MLPEPSCGGGPPKKVHIICSHHIPGSPVMTHFLPQRWWSLTPTCGVNESMEVLGMMSHVGSRGCDPFPTTCGLSSSSVSSPQLRHVPTAPSYTNAPNARMWLVLGASFALQCAVLQLDNVSQLRHVKTSRYYPYIFTTLFSSEVWPPKNIATPLLCFSTSACLFHR